MRSTSTSTLASPSPATTIIPASTSPPILPVLIAGAGLGGLALANSLSRARIPYLVLERDSDLHGRAQGYRIALDGGGAGNKGGADGLRAVLSEGKFEVFEKTCGEECGASGRVDAKSGRLEAKGIWGMIGTGGVGLVWALLRRVVGRKWDGGRGIWRLFSPGLTTVPVDLKLPKTKSTAYQIDRRVVRSILLGPEIAPHVKYSAKVKSYTVHDASVEAHLTSGESIHGSLLVGADGIRSNIAAQLFASANVPAERTRTLDLGVRIVYGKAPLTPQLLERMNKGLHKGMAFIVDSVKLPPKERVMVVVKTMNFDHNISSAEKVKAGLGEVQTPEDYVFFAMVSRKELWQDALKRMSPAVTENKEKAEEDVDDRLIRLTGQSAKDLSLFVARERSWDPSVLALLEGQDASQTAVLRTTSSDPAGPPLWDTNERVTLLGDAVHCMPPTGGQGGNMALWDGALLGQELAEEWEAKRAARMSLSEDEQKGGEVGWKWSRGTIRRYEDSMRAHTGDIVAMACIGATYLFGGEEVWR